MNQKILFLIFLLSLGLNYITCESEKIEEIVTITSDDESTLRNAMFQLWKLGGIVYIDTPVINIKTPGSLSVTGTISGGIIGIRQPNGEYPRLNFKEQRDSTKEYYNSGIDVVGSNKIIKNIIVENVGHYGIFVNGQRNVIDHVILRYNGYSGIYISSECNTNSFNFVYSYRNFNFLDEYSKAEGFTINNGAINNIYSFCFAWDNQHNGFGFNSDRGKNKNGTQTYAHSASWNNGNMDVFSGKYDFDNGKSLDKNLWTIQKIMESDENFEKNYENQKFSIKNAKINSKSAIEYFSDNNNNDEDGNGFNFGDEKNEQTPSNARIADYCVAFENKAKGFNNNKSKNFSASFTNCVGFNNNINYELPYTFSKWSNNWSWESKEEDLIDEELLLKKPNNIKSANKIFNSVKEQIIDAVNSNIIPDNITFEKAIKSLLE